MGERGGRRGGGERGSKWNKSTFEVSEFRTLKGERPSSSTSVSLSKILYFRFIFILFFVSFFLSFFLSFHPVKGEKKKRNLSFKLFVIWLQRTQHRDDVSEETRVQIENKVSEDVHHVLKRDHSTFCSPPFLSARIIRRWWDRIPNLIQEFC